MRVFEPDLDPFMAGEVEHPIHENNHECNFLTQTYTLLGSYAS